MTMVLTILVLTLALTACGPPSLVSIPPSPTITTRVHLGWKVVPSACMEALMHADGGSYAAQAAGFSQEVSRLAAAPRRPLTNRMHDDRWLRFAYWTAGQGFVPLSPTAA